VTQLIYQLIFQILHVNVFAYADCWFFLSSTVPEIIMKNDVSSSMLNLSNLKYFQRNLQNLLFSNFYYKSELDSNFLSYKSTQMPLITDNANYIQQINPKSSSIHDWSIFYFLTLLDKKKEKIFLKHLIFNKNYLLTFKWLSLSHQMHIFNTKM